jgi:hypothetical protein
MKRMMAVSVLAMTMFAAACATTYQSSDTSIAGGYSEVRLTPTSWRVLVEGNGFTERGEVEQFLMRRAAELTLEQGMRYFVLENHRAWTNARVDRDGDLITSPANAAVVIAVAQQERDAFDAAKVVVETNAAAKAKLSAAARRTLETM